MTMRRQEVREVGPVFWVWRLLGWPFRRLLGMLRFYRRHRIKMTIVVIALGTWYALCLPDRLFDTPYSTVLEDRGGHLLGARIAKDGQWRFPTIDSVPPRFAAAVIEFEDHEFYDHHGISFRAFARAMKQNVNNGKVVSGGSTISMQVIRLSRQGQERSVLEKVIEVIQATRMELSYSKEDILKMWASHAPFGGNVVGLDAASWRYFGRGPNDLSWAESATLAVLPNAPALIHPGRNRDQLLAKRNRLLDRMLENGTFDTVTWQLATVEPLPDRPYPIPQYAPHLLDRMVASGHRGKRIRSTVNERWQRHATEMLARHGERLAANKIYNGAVLILDVNTSEVLAYVGNSTDAEQAHHNMVDIIPAPRSTGSILKPFLYASMVHDGQLTPNMLVPDIPSHYSGYVPKNFYNEHDGAVPAGRALSRSLNVPAVRMLHEYGIARFQRKLKQMGMRTLHRSAREYGLTLILGGAEASLWDLAGMYANMGRTLNNFPENAGVYQSPTFTPRTAESAEARGNTPLSPGAVWHTFEAMQQVARPDGETGWEQFSSSGRIAWKTGTSFGFRDAWAIGVNRDYVVAVWVGNADGEGRPGLVGVKAAAPLLFDVFAPMEGAAWFDQPWDDMTEVQLCRQSGHRASDYCPDVDTIAVANTSLRTLACPYHRVVHLDQSEQFQVDANCADVTEMVHQVRFVLPPAMEWYYKLRHPGYEVLPPFQEGCQNGESRNPIALLYPRPGSRIHVPVELDGQDGRTVFEATHSDPKATLYWHLDHEYLGQTEGIHQLELNPDIGDHTITIVDPEGFTVACDFTVPKG